MLCFTPLQLRFYLPASSTHPPLFPPDQMPGRCDPAPSLFSFLRSHLCPGDRGDASRRSSHPGYFIQLCPLFGDEEGKIYNHPSRFTTSAIKGQTPLPEEQPERFADVLCTQNDPLLLPPYPTPQKGSPKCPPHLAPSELRCRKLGGNHQVTPSQV